MENRQKEKLRKLGLSDEQVDGVVRLIENQEHFELNEDKPDEQVEPQPIEDDGDPHDLSVHSPGSGYYDPDVPAPKKFIGIDFDYVQEVYNEILLEVLRDPADGATRQKIKTLMDEKLPYYTIKCDEENNPIEVTDSGHIWARVIDRETNNYIDLVF